MPCPRQGYHSYIMPGGSFNSYYISIPEFYIVFIPVITLTGVFESYLNNVIEIIRARNIF